MRQVAFKPRESEKYREEFAYSPKSGIMLDDGLVIELVGLFGYLNTERVKKLLRQQISQEKSQEPTVSVVSYPVPIYDQSQTQALLDEVLKLHGDNLFSLNEAIAYKHLVWKIEEVILHSAVPRPASLRDFYAFEQHVKAANQNRGRDVPKEWYAFPVFYFANHSAIYGHEDVIPCPSYTEALDYELEVACVIGKGGVNIPADKAEDHIYGYMIFNDWSARDVQRREMAVGLGPAKGKDFANSFGSYLVTPDELADRYTGRPGVYDLEMVARVNGKELSRGNWKDLYWSFGQMIERASQDVMLHEGDVIGSGTVGTGCLLEVTKGQGPWLQPGDVVELEVERLGVLRNTIGKKKTHP